MKNHISTLSKIFVTGLLFLWLSRYVNLRELLQFVRDIPLNTMIMVIIYGVVNLLGQAFRFLYAARLIVGPLTKKQILLSYFSGFTFRFLLPASIGEVGKTLYLPGTTKEKLFTFLIDAFFCTGVLFFFFGISAYSLYPERWYMLFFSLLYIVLFVVYWLLKDRPGIKRFVPERVPYAKIAVSNIVTTIFTYATFASQYWYLLKDYDISWLTQSKICYFVIGVGSLPISFAGLGLREGASTFALSPFGVPAEAAVGVSLLVFVINVLIPAAVGVILITFFSDLKLSDVRNEIDLSEFKRKKD